MSQQFYSNEGQLISLGRKLGQGHEGAIFEVYGHSNLVAKVYLEPTTAAKRAAKLNAQVNLKTERLLKLSAWPTDTLHEKRGGTFKGFLMPYAMGHRDIHMLYGIKSRHAEYPDARWPFLIQAASNVARAFNVIHEHGHVIGDVNQGGVLVSKSATIRLVDCDSFQVSVNGNRYLCEVGVPTHTPPELQDRSFKGVVRTQDHDAFGLAVIIFQLLFMGRHPFSGAFLGRGDMFLERAIKEFRFAYGPDATARQMKQPPATLPLEAVSTPIVNLFERAFLSSGARPRAPEWISPLVDLGKNLKQCPQNSGHSYLSTLSSCPWCKIESRAGVVVFFPIYVAGVATASGFDIAAIWTQIENVPQPAPLSALPVKSSVSVTPSPKATQVQRARRLRSYTCTVALAAFYIVLFAVPLGGGATFFLILLAAIGTVVFARTGQNDSARELRRAKEDAENALTDIQRRWRPAHDVGRRFSSKLSELKTTKAEYQNLPSVLQRKLQQLEKEVYQRQLERFLDRFRIDKARISGIGHARQITLRSYGLETAADITKGSVLGVPGFGPTYTAKLLAWRSNIEQTFVFDSKRGVDPQDSRNVEIEIQNRRAKLEQELRSGVTVLRQLSDQAQSTNINLHKSADIAVKNLGQAEADLAAGTAAFSLVPLVLVFIAAIWALALFRTNTSPRAQNFTNTATPSPLKKADAPGTLLPEQTAAQARSAYDKGVALSKSRKFLEAEAAYVQATTLRSDFADAFHELGYVRIKCQKFDKAIAALTQAHTLRPKYAETSRLLGQAYEVKENWTEAAKYYREAAGLQPKHALTQYNLGRALKNSGDLDSAIQAMQDAIKLKADWAAAHYELGLLFVETGEPDMAREEHNILTTLDQKLADKLSVRLNQ